MIERYVWRAGRFIDKRTGRRMKFKNNAVSMPVVQSDIEAYQSPLGEHWIDGRRAQREELKRNDCVISDIPKQNFDREEYTERKARQARGR